MRIALIAHHTAPIAPPFAGGVESHTWWLAAWLAGRGHRVTVFAMDSTEIPGVVIHQLHVDEVAFSDSARRDVSAQPAPFLGAHHAYLRLMTELTRRCPFDVVHINSLHYLPVAMASAVAAPCLLTLHCPPTPWLESALQISSAKSIRLVAVSRALASQWTHLRSEPEVVLNGVDTGFWQAGGGGTHAVWAGRIVPEKAPHLAIQAARQAGLPIRMAGPIFDHSYWHEIVEPLLGPDAEYVGHLGQEQLVNLVGGSRVAVQSPVWEEPYGLSAAEAMSCGTPVAAFARGGLPEVVDPRGGVLAEADSPAALHAAIVDAAKLDRGRVRAYVQDQLSIERMGLAYEALYEQMRVRRPAQLPRAFWPAGVSLERLLDPLGETA